MYIENCILENKVVYYVKKQKGINMYTSIVESFLNSIHALRLYVNSVEPIVLKEIKALDYDSFMAMLLYVAKEAKIRNWDLNDLTFSDEIPEEHAQKIKENIKHFTEIVEVSGDGKTGRYRSLPKPIKESYIRYGAQQKQDEIMYSGTLMLLVTYFENTIAKILKTDLLKHPQRMSLDTKTVSYKMLEMSESIDDVRNLLIENEVMSMMYKSLSDWIEYFKKSIKLKLTYVTEVFPKLIEVIARRNVIVHNDGIVNNVYLNLVSEEYRLGINNGDVLKVDRQYIMNAIDLIESVIMAIVLEMWISEGVKDEDEVEKIRGVIYEEYLIFERWEIARILYEVCLESNKLKSSDELECKINKWQCYKWIGRFDQIKKEVEELDVSAYEPKYKLGVLALLDKYDEFFSYFDEQSDLNENELRGWPLFREVRKNEIYIQRYGINEE